MPAYCVSGRFPYARVVAYDEGLPLYVRPFRIVIEWKQASRPVEYDDITCSGMLVYVTRNAPPGLLGNVAVVTRNAQHKERCYDPEYQHWRVAPLPVGKAFETRESLGDQQVEGRRGGDGETIGQHRPVKVRDEEGHDDRHQEPCQKQISGGPLPPDRPYRSVTGEQGKDYRKGYRAGIGPEDLNYVCEGGVGYPCRAALPSTLGRQNGDRQQHHPRYVQQGEGSRGYDPPPQVFPAHQHVDCLGR